MGLGFLLAHHAVAGVDIESRHADVASEQAIAVAVRPLLRPADAPPALPLAAAQVLARLAVAMRSSAATLSMAVLW